MALIGEMQYLTIGGNTYSLPSGGGDIIKELTLTISGNTYTINKTYQELQDEYLNSFVILNVMQGSNYDYKAKGICIYDELNDEFIVAQYTNDINSDNIGGLFLNYGVAINYNNQQRKLFQYKFIPLETTVTDVEVDGTSVVTGGIAEINSEIFVVNLVYTGNIYTSDKTVSEIISAYNNGKTVVAKDTSFNKVYFVSDIDVQNSTVYFGHVTFNDSYNLRDPVYLENNYFYIDSNGVDSGYYSFQVAYDLHTHGNITNTGDITTTATIASGDRLVINDESASKLNNSSITFGTSTSQYLANNGTWQNIPTVPTKTSDLTNDSGFINSIKTINNQSLLGSGDITVSTTAAQIIRWTESA